MWFQETASRILHSRPQTVGSAAIYEMSQFPLSPGLSAASKYPDQDLQSAALPLPARKPDHSADNRYAAVSDDRQMYNSIPDSACCL